MGCQHTQDNFKTAFWKTDLFDYKPFETWFEDGSKDTYTLANERVEYLLKEYQAPQLDPGIEEGLEAFINKRKESMPDSMI